ncbi:hypothetical protein G4228_008785 [Cervus hanglu yarkandensis]|nr:hypothetical protein G4228_008785 [Cervus hanglu yarkandensis]
MLLFCFISGTSGSSCLTAALGNTWSHSVNTRLILQYLGSERRQILIAKSPLAPFTAFGYTIEKEGLVLQGKIFGRSHFFRLIMLSTAHCG